MSAVAFDTLKYAKRLKEAGFTEQQAEALASAQVDLIEANLATKSDISELTRAMEALRTELHQGLKDLEYRLTIRLGGMMALAVGVVVTLVKLL